MKTNFKIIKKKGWRNLTGEVFDQLTVIERVEDYIYPGSGRHEPKWKCKCNCNNPDNEIIVIHHNLLNGHVHCCKNCKSNAFKDLTGQTFGKLTVIERGPDYIWNNEREVQWWCECSCKNHTKVLVRGSRLRSGLTKSCGCAIIEASTIHGGHGTRLYGIWEGIKRRCYNPNTHNFDRYGGKKDKDGNPAPITICDEWKDDFAAFRDWAMSHGYDENADKYECTIDRIDNNKGYSPDNCRWVNMRIQSNNRDNNRFITFNGETKTVAEWSGINGISSPTIYHRLYLGWSDEDALNTPVNDYIIKVTNSKGETHTLKEWGEITGFSESLLYDRIYKYNWDVDKALYTKVDQSKKGINIIHNGDLATINEWENILGFKCGIISHRINRNDWDIEKALTTPPLNQKGEFINPINAIYFLDDNGHPISEAEHDKLENNN